MDQSIRRCVLSGSYHRDRAGLERAYLELVTSGCQVLSPHRLDFDSETTGFVRDSAEHNLGEREIELHHLTAIRQSHFVWLHVANGHVGTSASFEIGYAHALSIPVFATESPSDLMLRQFVRIVPSVFAALH